MRQSINVAKGKKLTSKAEMETLKSLVANFNERVGQRNREAEALRVRSNESQSNISTFNRKVDEFNKLVGELKSASTEYETKSRSLRIDLARLEESCSGTRRLVKE